MSPTQSPYSRKITLLLEDRDLDGLVTVLRSPTQPELRAQAALALGEMQDVDATESLARSTLEDPDPAVQAAARQALDQLLGNQAKMVIDSYRGGPPESDPWLVEPDEGDDEDEDDFEDEDVEQQKPRAFHKIKRLLTNHDLNGLVAILRNPAHPELRALAARALGKLRNVDATESLVRSTQEDPDPAVQAAARQALEQLHGNRAQLVISSYPPGSPESDPWLVEPDEEKTVDDYENEDYEEPEPPSVHKINLLLADEDLNGLVAILRSPAHPELRASAAVALGDLGDEDAAESLVRSTLQDPDPDVQSAARQALEELLGSQASQEIDSYRNGPPENDPWLVEPDELEGDAAYASAREDPLDLDGLMRVASHESNTKLRLRAIHMLALSRDMRATDILAYLTLRDEKKSIRAAARAALDLRYGDQAEEILKNYQDSLSPAGDEDDFDEEEQANGEEVDEDEADGDELDEDDDEEEFEEDDELEDEEEEPEVLNENARIPRSPSEFPKVSADPTYRGGVVEDAGFPWQTVLLIALVIVIVVAVVLLLKGSL